MARVLTFGVTSVPREKSRLRIVLRGLLFEINGANTSEAMPGSRSTLSSFGRRARPQSRQSYRGGGGKDELHELIEIAGLERIILASVIEMHDDDACARRNDDVLSAGAPR